MTTRTKPQVDRRGFCQGILPACLSRNSVLKVLVFSLTVVGSKAGADSQGNLANLYNWSNETAYVSPGSMGQFVSVFSETSADFFGGFTTNPGLPNAASPCLSEQFNTTPGVTYEISFTLENLNSFEGSALESFGNVSMNYNLPFAYLDGGNNYTDTPVNVDFTALATSTVTAMSFQFNLDPEGGAAGLSNLLITEVPESSAARLFCYGGCALLLAKQLRRLVKKRTPAVKPIA